MQKRQGDTAAYVLAFFMLLASLVLYTANKIQYYKMADAYVTEPAGAHSGQGGGKISLIHLPYTHPSTTAYMRMPPDKIPSYVFTLHLNAHWYQSGKWRFIPDDCINAIRVNDADVPLYLPKETRCDVKAGFVYDLKPYMHNGENTVEVTVSDDLGGNYGLAVSAVRWAANPIYSISVGFLFAGAFWLLLLRRTFDVSITAMAMLSLWCCMRVFTHSNYTTFNPDFWGHSEYINYVKHNLAVPSPHQGWSYFNPPLYYIIVALIDSVTGLVTRIPFFGPRCFSAFLLLAFEFYGLLAIKKLVTDKRLQVLCSAMMLFWPLYPGLIGRVNNEMLLYAFWAAMIYHLLLWHLGQRVRDMVVVLVLCGLMFLVKTSALVPLGFAGAVVFYHLAFTRTIEARYGLRRGVLLAAAFLALCLGYNFGRTIYDKLVYEPRLGMVIGNVYSDRILGTITTTNTLDKFTTLDLDAFLNEPYWFYTSYPSGAAYFWISYIKTALFGDFVWPPHDLAIALNLTLLSLFVFLLLGGVATRCKGMAFPVIGISVTMLAQLIDRLIVRTTITNEARFTFPVIILFIAMLGMILQQLSQNEKYKPLAAAGEALVGGFAVMGLLFIGVFS